MIYGFVLEYKVYFQHYVFKVPILCISVNLFLTVMEAVSKKLGAWGGVVVKALHY